MVELEADDALASAAAVARDDPRVDRVFICTPDKDLGAVRRGPQGRCSSTAAQDRRLDEAGVRRGFGVGPRSIPDYLALVGDTADGFPGLPGWGAKSAATVLARYEHLDAIPDDVARVGRRGARRGQARGRRSRPRATRRELFLDLATLRTDADVGVVDDWEWRGAEPELAAWAAAARRRDLVTADGTPRRERFG